MLLKSCFFGDLSPSSAEDILIKQMSKSFLVRQCDRDPSKLILVVKRDGKITHIIVPDFGTEGFSRRLIKNRLEDTTDEVDKLLASFDCQHPVIPDIPFIPVPQSKKRSTELTGGAGRCSICPLVGDPRKIALHPANHYVKLCQNCGKYVMSKTFSYHSKKCTYDREKILSCDKCDYSSFHKGDLAKHERAVHSQPFACDLEECDKKFGTKKQLEKHMEKHEKRKKKEKKKKKYVNNSNHVCKICGEVFGSPSSKYRHVNKVHINPTVKSSAGVFKLSGVSLEVQYRQRGRKYKFCDKCSFKTLYKSHLQTHIRSHSKLKRPTYFTGISTCKRKNGKVYYHRVKAKVKAHMKSCRFYKLTLSSVPKSMLMADSVCFLASKVDISNNKMNTILKWVSEQVGQELMDYNLPKALSKNLNSCKQWYYSKQLEFTDKKGNKRTTSFVCMESLADVVDEIIKRRNIVNAMAAVSMDGGKDKEVAALAVFDLDNPDPLTDCGLSAGAGGPCTW